MTDLVVIGASGLAREALAVVRETGSHRPIGVLDDGVGSMPPTFDGLPVLGRVSDIDRYDGVEVLVCVGSGAARERIVHLLAQTRARDIHYATVVDPSVRNPAGCPVGAGSILLAHARITAAAQIGGHVVMMPGVTVTHDDVIDDFVTLTAGVSLGGGVHVERGAYIGMNAAVLPGVRVGARATIGMCAAVLTDVPGGETWAGVPARALHARSMAART